MKPRFTVPAGARLQGCKRLRQAGVSLIEALVAMTVVGIGMVSLVGVQASLRGNADVSKQRSEAVRLGQSAIEDWRAFTTMAQYTAFDDFNDPALPLGSATYTVQRIVEEADPPLRGKALSVAVTWRDRSDTEQTVRLNTFLAGISPELGASLSLAPTGGKTRGPGSRNLVIPRQAIDLLDGTSAMRPAGGGDTVWRFNNLTGEVQLCSLVDSGLGLVASNLGGCSGRYLLYSGFMRFAPTTSPPTPADATTPAGPVDADVRWTLTSTTPSTNANGLCFDEAAQAADAASNTRVYYCAVSLITPPGATATLTWNGRMDFGPDSRIAAVDSEVSNAKRRVCRYPQTIYPLDNVREATINQNYLVISAGDGSTPFSCPTGTTAHQPTS